MSVGRPIEFDPDKALEQAIEVFWDKGYAATSMSDLLAAMNLSKSSLYQTFGSKQQLFTRCLDHYGKGSAMELRTQLGDASSAKDFLHTFFYSRIHTPPKGEKFKGCLVVNTVCELGESEHTIGMVLNSEITRTRKLLQKAVEQAQAEGDIDADKEPEYLAGFLMTGLCGINVMAIMKEDQSVLEAAVEQILQHLD